MKILAMLVTKYSFGSYSRFLELGVESGVVVRTDDICEASICESKDVLGGIFP